jgi:hypothetical protein
MRLNPVLVFERKVPRNQEFILGNDGTTTSLETLVPSKSRWLLETRSRRFRTIALFNFLTLKQKNVHSTQFMVPFGFKFGFPFSFCHIRNDRSIHQDNFVFLGAPKD